MIAPIRTPRRPAAEAVCAGLSGADRLRRTREAGRRIWQAAPAIAAASLGLAAGSRWAGWPTSLAFIVPLVGVVTLIAYAAIVRRRRPISDGLSSRIDADAALDGELRSATWFAMHGAENPWVDLHLDRAAARVNGVDWAALYPPVRARRAQVASLLLIAGAVVLTISVPRSVSANLDGRLARPDATLAADLPEDLLLLIPPELQKQLEALLAASRDNTASPAARAASIAQLRALLAQLSQLKDREALNELARLAEANKEMLSADAAEQMKDLVDRTNLSSETSKLPPEIRKALEKLAENLSEKKSEPGAPKDPTQALAEKKDSQRGDSAKSDSGADVDEASIQSVKEASAGGGAGVMMMANDDAAMGGEPGMGVGGGSSPPSSGRGTLAAIAQALKHETVEASTDNPGENVQTEIKRKTEQGDAKVTFTGSATRAFDRSRVASPPPVPEARRPGVQTYFVRKQ